MKKNVGGADRIIRIILGIGLLSLIVVGPKTLWGLVGLVPLLTATFSFCPLFLILGMSTCPINKK